MTRHNFWRSYTPIAIVVGVAYASALVHAQFTRAQDPGVRGGAAGAGNPLPGLNSNQLAYFQAGLDVFNEQESVDEDGLGPMMNLDSCGGCHAAPSVGGSSPEINPQVEFATALGARNQVPPFITLHGPVREVRFVRAPDGSPDGGVHALFSIAGRSDAPGCMLKQNDFSAAIASHNLIFRIPTPVFGLGLVEQIPDRTILANAAANGSVKTALGIRGRANTIRAGNTISGAPNNNGNDGTVARFGWKAQNKSLMIFSGEAYNVEMGVSNDIFPNERNETPECQGRGTPNNSTDLDADTTEGVLSDMEKFAIFMRFLAPPTPVTTGPNATSIARGRDQFTQVGCAMCHTPSMKTGRSSTAALSGKDVNLFSDLLVHDMGPGLADGVSQGQAGPSEFRTAPLWGLGQRRFFLHDGRTSDLIEAILAHRSGRDQNASEANGIIARYLSLSEREKQDLLNFLRSL